MFRTKHPKTRLLTYDELANTSSGSAQLADAQATKDQATLNRFYQLALEFFKNQAKNSGAVPDNELGFDPCSVDHQDTQRTILYWAIACFQPESEIKSLLQQGSKTDELYMKANSNQISAFFTALTLDNNAAATTLLDNNENLAITQDIESKLLPAHFLVIHNKLAFLEILLEKNPLVAEITAGQELFTPLHTAVYQQENAHTIASLICKYNELSCNILDAKGRTPLYHATKLCDTKLTRLFLDKGSDVALTSASNRTVLQLAAEKGFNDIVHILLVAGITNDEDHLPKLNKLNMHNQAALRLLRYISKRESEERFTGAVSSYFYQKTGYSGAYSKEQKLPVARHVLENIKTGMPDPLSDLSDQELKILKDGRTGEITARLIKKHGAIVAGTAYNSSGSETPSPNAQRSNR